MAHITAQLARKVATFEVKLTPPAEASSSPVRVLLEASTDGVAVLEWCHPSTSVVHIGDRIKEIDSTPVENLDIGDVTTRIKTSPLVLKLERTFPCGSPSAIEIETGTTSTLLSSGSPNVTLEHLATGCNRSCESCDWGPDNLIAYAGGHTIILFSLTPTGKSVIRDVLVGHRARTNCVSWVRTPAGEYTQRSYVVSGSTDNDIRVWRKGSSDGRFSCRATLAHHSGAVMGLACLSQRTGACETITVCSASADNSVGIWRANIDDTCTSTSDSFALLQTISMGNGFALALALSVLPASDGSPVPVLAIGGDDAKIRVYTEAPRPHEGAASTEVFRFGVAVPGHEDWVRTLAFAATLPMGVDAESPPSGTPPGTPALYLASGAQDTYIRVWRIAEQSVDDTSADTADTTASAFARSSLHRNAMKDFDRCFPVDAIQSESHDASSTQSSVSYAVRLDALLVGHDNWVYSVRWQPPVYQASCQAPYQPPVVLSASMDRTMIMWSPDVSSNVWVDSVRMGEAGGNYIQGLFGGVFNSNGSEVLGHGFHGAFHLWKREADTTQAGAPAPSLIGSKWTPHLSMTGHFGPVRDMAWEPTRGAFLTTASDDQTVRVLAPCCKEQVVQEREQLVRKVPVGWHEMARPQIHGYDMRTLCCVAPDVIASAADEKVIRVFQAPSTTLEDLGRFVIDATDLRTFAPQLVRQTGGNGAGTPTRPMGASIPALGLSNKAVFDVNTDVPQPDLEGNAAFTDMVVLPFADTRLQEPPLEEHLLQNTLWPETHKLYGHGFELVTLATNHKATLLLSSCRATTPEHAVIRAWDTTTWTERFSLSGHKLTVTRLAFSPNDDWLVSGSRDRQICIYRRTPTATSETPSKSPWERAEDGAKSEGRDGYVLVQTLTKAHDRIVWDLAWSPDGTVFASASRDKVVKFWSRKRPDESEWALVGKLGKLQDSITALAWCPSRATAEAPDVLAVGFDNGRIELYRTLSGGVAMATWELLHALDGTLCHTATVRRLQWRPMGGATDVDTATSPENRMPMLASCSMDGSVRLFNVDIAALVG
eukprot:m.65244 g.65244  ORF g.65244 m.65244 type:complete len:1053 (+) comp15910_c0_seq8:220-3378(+)